MVRPNVSIRKSNSTFASSSTKDKQIGPIGYLPPHSLTTTKPIPPWDTPHSISTTGCIPIREPIHAPNTRVNRPKTSSTKYKRFAKKPNRPLNNRRDDEEILRPQEKRFSRVLRR